MFSSISLKRVLPLFAVTAALVAMPAAASDTLGDLAPTAAFACDPNNELGCEVPETDPGCPGCPIPPKPDGCGEVGHSWWNWMYCNWHITTEQPDVVPSTERPTVTVAQLELPRR